MAWTYYNELMDASRGQAPKDWINELWLAYRERMALVGVSTANYDSQPSDLPVSTSGRSFASALAAMVGQFRNPATGAVWTTSSLGAQVRADLGLPSTPSSSVPSHNYYNYYRRALDHLRWDRVIPAISQWEEAGGAGYCHPFWEVIETGYGTNSFASCRADALSAFSRSTEPENNPVSISSSIRRVYLSEVAVDGSSWRVWAHICMASRRSISVTCAIPEPVVGTHIDVYLPIRQRTTRDLASWAPGSTVWDHEQYVFIDYYNAEYGATSVPHPDATAYAVVDGVATNIGADISTELAPVLVYSGEAPAGELEIVITTSAPDFGHPSTSDPEHWWYELEFASTIYLYFDKAIGTYADPLPE